MSTRKQSPRSRTTARLAAAGSWTALLAATTLGNAADTVRTQVRADGLSAGAYRLVVQSYDEADGAVPGRDARPVGSVQRAVTADELRAGVSVNLLELRKGPHASGERPLVVAWIEAEGPDLEFDGRAARPAPGSRYGIARRPAAQHDVEISLDRTLAA